MKSPRNHGMTKTVALMLALAAMFLLTGFSFGSSMPFNGDISFHEVALTIPRSYIRDSTQSNDNLWIFERDFYSKYIILTRSNLIGSENASLNLYVNRMRELGADAHRVSFLQCGAVSSAYNQNGKFCQEMLFIHNGSVYAIALRGGTDDEFLSLLDTVALIEPSATESPK